MAEIREKALEIKKMRQLTRRQEVFCAEFIKDPQRSIYAAALRAGYTPGSSKVQAYKMFKTPAVQERIRQLEAQVAEDNRVTIERIIASLLRIAEKAEEDGRFAAAIRAQELLGKYLGMFTEKTESNINFHANTADAASLDREIARLLGTPTPPSKPAPESQEPKEPADAPRP